MSSSPLPTLAHFAHLSPGPAHMFQHRDGILGIVAAQKEKRRYFAGAVKDSLWIITPLVTSYEEILYITLSL